MIPVLITIKNKVLKFINLLKSNFHIIAVTIIMILAAFLFIQHNHVEYLRDRLDKTQSNYEYYMNKSTLAEQLNKVLLFTLNDYKETKDSLINEIKTTLKKLKIKDKELLQILFLELKIKHDTTVIVKSNDFELEIKPNSLTSIIINKKDSLLTHKLSIENAQTLYITNKRVYRNKYKNWFIRLLHFDFKKKNNIEYLIHNSNNIIKITDSRMVELN